MVLARSLHESSPPEKYEKANRLAWELALWLPADIYKAMGKALTKPDSKTNPLSVVVSVRNALLGNADGNLTQDDILSHAPGIGKKHHAPCK